MKGARLHENKLVGKHLAEWKVIITTDLQAWQHLRMDHKQAIEKVGLMNFIAWEQQKEEVYVLGVHLTQRRVELKKSQQLELEMLDSTMF